MKKREVVELDFTSGDKTIKREKESNEVVVNSRVWEIDFLRGVIIILMVLDHLMWSIQGFVYHFFDCNVTFIDGVGFINGINQNGVMLPDFLLSYMNTGYTYYFLIPFRWAFRPVVLIIFFILSGISCNFSKNNHKRGLLLLLCGGIITVITYVLSYLNVVNFYSTAISFGVLSLYGTMILITYYLKKLVLKLGKNNLNYWYIVVFFLSLTSILISYIIREYKWNYHVDMYDPLSVFIGFIGQIIGFSNFGGDFFPLFPYLAYFLIGEVMGSLIYRTKQSLFKKEVKVFKPITFIGRNTIWVYLLHIPIITIIHAILYWISGFHLSF